MTSLDWILALVLVSSAVAGVMAGFARVAVGLAAGILGLVFGFWFYRMPAAWFAEYFQSAAASNVLGFLLIFFAVLLIGGLVARVLAAIFKWAGLSWLDRLLGLAFGFVRGALIAAVLVTVVTAFAPDPPPRWIARSELMPYFSGMSRVLAAIAPHEFREAFDLSINRIKRIWEGQPSPKPNPEPPQKEDLKRESC